MAIDSLRLSGLDTLSERALRRLTDRWTGELYSPDSVEVISREQAATSDTFRSIVEGWQRARELYHDAAVDAIMGSDSHLAPDVVPGEIVESGETLSEQVLHSEAWWSPAAWSAELYHFLVVVLFLYYIFCLYRYFDDVKALFSSVFRHDVVSSGRVAERRRSDIFYGSLGKLFMLGICFVGIIATGAAMHLNVGLSREVIFYAPFAGMLLFLIVILAQNLLLGIVGVVTHSMGEVASLLRIRLSYFVLATLLSAPLLLIAMIGQGPTYDVWLKIGCVAAAVAVILFVRESVGFFISKKVSILHWILYLCTVEILPLTLLWQAAVRLR